MGRKSRIQSKAIVKSLGSESDENDISKYFNQMIGSEKADPAIVMPKYNQIMDLMEKINKLFDSCQEVIGKITFYEDGGSEMLAFNEKLSSIVLSRVTNDKFKPDIYTAVKNHDVVHTLIESCSSMSDIHVHLKKEWADIDKKFFMRYNSNKFTPFSFAPNLDFKRLWLVDANENDQLMEYIFTFLKSCFKQTHAIYKIVTSPDVDVSNLSRIIVGAITNLKKHLPRCEKAFKKIEESVGMLENNFDSYYKDFIQTKDPSNILTAFIGDVASNAGDTDVQLIIECRRIVSFYNKHARKQASNGGASSEKMKMFDALMSKYNILEKKALNAMDIDETKIDDDEGNADNADGVADATNETELPDLDDLLKQINDPKVMNIALAK